VSKGHCAAFQVLHLAPGKIFPRLERCDVEFDLPETFLPEFPPAMFLQNRPELGDVSRGFSFLNAPKLGELAVAVAKKLGILQRGAISWLASTFVQRRGLCGINIDT
jgi:hypothetical protein